jgi:hypothetical protein
MLYFGGIALYLGIGLLIAGLSIRVWLTQDSASFIARLMFPWQWHENCIGEMASFSVCGAAYEGGMRWFTLYIIAMAVGWPCKAIFNIVSWSYVRFIYQG